MPKVRIRLLKAISTDDGRTLKTGSIQTAYPMTIDGRNVYVIKTLTSETIIPTVYGDLVL
jgi:hypothetical protein